MPINIETKIKELYTEDTGIHTKSPERVEKVASQHRIRIMWLRGLMGIIYNIPVKYSGRVINN